MSSINSFPKSNLFIPKTLLKNGVLGYSSPSDVKLSLQGRTNLIALGDSITVGNGASSVENRYINLFATKRGLSLTNLAIGGRGYWAAANAIKPEIYNTSETLVVCAAGLNDIRRGTSQKTINKCLSALSAIILKQIARTATASGHSSITRVGSILGFAANTVGGFYPNSPVPGDSATYSNLEGSYWEYTFVGTDCGISFIGNSGDVAPYGLADIYIDGKYIERVNLNNKFDNISDGSYDNRRGAFATTYHGLSKGEHKLRVVAITNNNVPIDSFHTLYSPEEKDLCTQLVIVEPFYVASDGYYKSAVNKGTKQDSDRLAIALFQYVEKYRLMGYPIVFCPINSTYSIYGNGSVDSVHPGNTGHAKIAEGLDKMFYRSDIKLR